MILRERNVIEHVISILCRLEQKITRYPARARVKCSLVGCAGQLVCGLASLQQLWKLRLTPRNNQRDEPQDSSDSSSLFLFFHFLFLLLHPTHTRTHATPFIQSTHAVESKHSESNTVTYAPRDWTSATTTDYDSLKDKREA